MIQMMAPTMETRTASSAKGRPSSHPSGRHSPPSPPPQHIAGRSAFPHSLTPLLACLVSLVIDSFY